MLSTTFTVWAWQCISCLCWNLKKSFKSPLKLMVTAFSLEILGLACTTIIQYCSLRNLKQMFMVRLQITVPLYIILMQTPKQICTYFINYILGKLVTIRGTVMKIGNTMLQCTYMTFQCSTCSGTQLTKQQDGNYVLPTKCLTKGCRAQSSFIPLVRSQYTKMLGTQLLRIQELIEDTQVYTSFIWLFWHHFTWSIWHLLPYWLHIDLSHVKAIYTLMLVVVHWKITNHDHSQLTQNHMAGYMIHHFDE